MELLYDLIIIGGGPAGLCAGIYGARAKLNTLIIEKNKIGGQIISTDEVVNYAGSIENATGKTLVNRMESQCVDFGVNFINDNIIKVDLNKNIKVISGQKNIYKAKTIIIACGASPRKLNVEGEEAFTGRGISYCATCDGDFFEGLEIFTIGGGDVSAEESLLLTKFAKKVTIVHRKEELSAARYLVDRLKNNPKIHYLWNTVVKEFKGDKILNSIVFENINAKESWEYKANEEDGTLGAFIFIGYTPDTYIYKSALNLSENGYIITDEKMNTNIAGVFAAGDCREKMLRQVITATADGAIAAVSAEKYLDENPNL